MKMAVHEVIDVTARLRVRSEESEWQLHNRLCCSKCLPLHGEYNSNDAHDNICVCVAAADPRAETDIRK